MDYDRLKGADAQNIRAQQVQNSIDQGANQQSEERRRYALERALQLAHYGGANLDDLERVTLRIENYAKSGSFEGAAE